MLFWFGQLLHLRRKPAHWLLSIRNCNPRQIFGHQQQSTEWDHPKHNFRIEHHAVLLYQHESVQRHNPSWNLSHDCIAVSDTLNNEVAVMVSMAPTVREYEIRLANLASMDSMSNAITGPGGNLAHWHDWYLEHNICVLLTNLTESAGIWICPSTRSVDPFPLDCHC